MKSNTCIAGFWVIAITLLELQTKKLNTKQGKKNKKQVDRLLVGYYNFRYWLFHVST